MISKDITLGSEAREKILNGARAVYDAVKSTYSPQSGNISIELNWGKPVTTHDGVTVARSIKLRDPVENIGAQFLIEASTQTNKTAGDGTSGTVILGYHILNKAHKLMAAGHNPMAMRRGVERAAKDIVDRLSDSATPIKDGDLKRIAIISAGDKATGELIADTIEKVGTAGGVNVETHDGTEIEREIVDGLYWDKGLDSPYMMNELDARRALYENCFILVTQRKLKNSNDVKPLLQILKDTEQKRCLIVGDVSGEALETLVLNKVQGDINTLSVSPPAMGKMRDEFFQDVATMTGAKLIPGSFEMSTLEYEHLGYANKVISTETNTTIIEGDGDQKDIKARMKKLTESLEMLTNANQREKLEARLAKLSGKIGIIRVGSPTGIDTRERMFRVEDAVFATKAAREQGIVSGGGTALLKCSLIPFDEKLAEMSEDEATGYRMTFAALQEPFKQLMHNAGLEDVGYHVHATLKAKDGFGYNVKKMTDEPIDLIDAGVIDPAKVVKQIVENACSMAGVAMTNDGVITINRQDAKDFPDER